MDADDDVEPDGRLLGRPFGHPFGHMAQRWTYAALAVVAVVLLFAVLVSAHDDQDADRRKGAAAAPLEVPDTAGPFVRQDGPAVQERTERIVSEFEDTNDGVDLTYAEYRSAGGQTLSFYAYVPQDATIGARFAASGRTELRTVMRSNGLADPAAFDPGDLGGNLACSVTGPALQDGASGCGWVDAHGVGLLLIGQPSVAPSDAAEATRVFRALATPS